MLHVHPTAYRYNASPATPGGMAIIYKDLIASDQRTRQVIADVAPALDCALRSAGRQVAAG